MLLKSLATRTLTLLSMMLLFVACPQDNVDPPTQCLIGEVAQCDTNATCSIIEGVATCACVEGFNGNGVSCEEIDACAADPCDENATCDNLLGLANCTCADGWEGDGLTCDDADECTVATTCDATSEDCVNNDGSFTCVCKEGFAEDDQGCSIDPATFVADISARPLIMDIQGLGRFTVGGLGRVAVEIEMVSTPGAGNRIERVPSAVVYHNVTLRNISGVNSPLSGIVAWAGLPNDQRGVILHLDGLGTEQFAVELFDATVVSSDVTITDDSLAEIVVSMNLMFEDDTYVPPTQIGIADDATIVEVEGVGALAAQDIATAADDTADSITLSSISNSGNGGIRDASSVMDWMRFSIRDFQMTGDIPRRALSQIFRASGAEVSRINCFETFPSLLYYFNPTKTYGQTQLVDLMVATEICEGA